MSDKFSSDDGMQKLFESFRKTINEEMGGDFAARQVDTAVQAGSTKVMVTNRHPVLLEPNGNLHLSIEAGGEEFSVIAKLDQGDTEEMISLAAQLGNTAGRSNPIDPMEDNPDYKE